MNTIRKLMFNLIPDSHVVIGHSKRALLPFIGDIWKGLATQDDLEVLVQHINALTKQLTEWLRLSQSTEGIYLPIFYN
jgi:hypothetical protein